MYDSVKAIATLPVGWRARRLPEVTQIVDGHDVLRAESSLQGGEMSYLKVHPRYYIDARKGLGWGKSSKASDDPDLDGPDWNCFVIDREKSIEVHELTTSSLKADMDNARATLLKWLDENYPKHRDPFAYWSDCEGVVILRGCPVLVHGHAARPAPERVGCTSLRCIGRLRRERQLKRASVVPVLWAAFGAAVGSTVVELLLWPIVGDDAIGNLLRDTPHGSHRDGRGVLGRPPASIRSSWRWRPSCIWCCRWSMRLCWRR